MKRLIAAVFVSMICLVSIAQAAQEEIGLSMEAKPASGSLLREVHRPVSADLTVTVSNPDTETTIAPLKVANVTFPGDMDFFPDSRKTPVCPDSQLSEQSNLALGVANIVRLCPRSVVGTGTAVVQLAQGKSPQTTLTDPRLVIFNAGRNATGRPRVVIYGYSKAVNTGLLMRGTLASSGELKISIGVLPFDSSVSRFTLGVPGEPLEVEDAQSEAGVMTVEGQDPAFLRAKCSAGRWRATGSFVLGLRAYPSGDPLSEDTLLSSNPFELECNGRVGQARLRLGKVTGPRKLKASSRGSFRVAVSNPGTATARSVRIRATGMASGSSKVGSIAPGTSRKIRVPVRAASIKRSGKVTFVLSGKSTRSAKAVRKIKIG